jgi:hypothetical protein
MNPGCWKLLMIIYKTYVPQCLVINFPGKIKSMLSDGFNPSTPKKKVVKAPVGGLNAVKAPPKKVDVSTLTPIAKAPVKKKVAPTTTAKPVATSAPVANISGLSSILGTGG